jgi:hypothetical protein
MYMGMAFPAPPDLGHSAKLSADSSNHQALCRVEARKGIHVYTSNDD